MKGCSVAKPILVPSIFGEEIGVIMEDANGISFQYHKTFDAASLPISPFMLPFDPERVFNYYDTMHTNGLPGIFADSLPDKFGTIIVREYFRRQKGVDATLLRMGTLEMLSYVGDDGIGAIEYMPMQEHRKELRLTIREYASEIGKLYSGKTDEVIEALLAYAPSGGARPKALVLWNRQEDLLHVCHTSKMTEALQPYIIKFDEAGKVLTRVEYAYNQIAKEAGMQIPEVFLIVSDAKVHFATKRFDRDAHTGKKYHQATLAGLMHKDFVNSVFSYERFIRVVQVLTGDIRQAEEAYRRMVFNIIGKNCDDHLKNISFLMDEKGKWSLSPAYDLVYSYGEATFGEHRMTVNGKVSDIVLEDMLACGLQSGIEPEYMRDTIEEISDLFAGSKRQLLESGVPSEHTAQIYATLEPISVTGFADALKKARKHTRKRTRV
jgi:serine/threonine-protein kinase HipA